MEEFFSYKNQKEWPSPSNHGVVNVKVQMLIKYDKWCVITKKIYRSDTKMVILIGVQINMIELRCVSVRQ